MTATTMMTTTTPAATMTPREKGRITRRCSAIFRPWFHVQEHRPDDPIYLLAEGAVYLRNYPAMLIAIELWEQRPAEERAKSARDAKAALQQEFLKMRKADAQKEPYLLNSHFDHMPPPQAHLWRRFFALRIAAYYGAPRLSPLHRVITDAIIACDTETKGTALIMWDAMPEEEREAIVTETHARLTRAAAVIQATYLQEYDDWWIDALANPYGAPVAAVTGGITDREKAQLRERFGRMREEEHAAD